MKLDVTTVMPDRYPGTCKRIYRAVDRYGIVHLESERAAPVYLMVEREQAGWEVQHSDDPVRTVDRTPVVRRRQSSYWEEPLRRP